MICQRMEAGKGILLKLDTLVEDHFTHEMSINLHLDLVALTRTEDEKCGKELVDTEKC